MPQSKRISAADTARGTNIDTWPRLTTSGADVVLLPEELMFGAGNFVDPGMDGQVDGITVVRAEQPEFRHAYIGTRPDATTRQNPSPVPIEQSTYLVNHQLVPGDSPPGPDSLLPRIAAPGPPTVRLVSADKTGYPEATPDSPLWLAFGYSQGGIAGTARRSAPGPGVAFTGGQGQCYRVSIPEDIPPNITGLDIWMSEPGTSSATVAGPYRLQATVDLLTYSAKTYDLVGAYSFDSPAAGLIPGAPAAPKLNLLADVREENAAEDWYVVVAYQTAYPTDTYTPAFISGGLQQYVIHRDFHFSPLSPVVGPVTIPPDDAWLPVAGRGTGVLQLIRPPFPPEAIGWMAWARVPSIAGNPVWYTIGGATGYNPLPLSTTELQFTVRDLRGSTTHPDLYDPSGNYSSTGVFGFPPPDAAPEPPLPFGATRPTPGKYYVRATEESRGLETRPSAPTEVNVGENDIMLVEFYNPKNRLPNATFREKDANGLPVSYTITETGGQARVEAGWLILETLGVQTGSTPDALTPKVFLNSSEEWSVSVPLKMEYPVTGTLAGQVQVVLRQLDANGTPTDTVLASLSSPGETLVRTKILPTGSVGTYVWNASTTQAQILYRFSGASKNATLRVSQQVLKGYGWFFRRRTRVAGATSSTDVPPETVVPPGVDVAVEPPPPTIIPPAGDTVSGPDRPTSSGTTLETSGYESGLPGGWAQNTSGGAAISTTAGAALSGSLGLQLLKSAGGSLATANLSKTFNPPSGLSARHDSGLAHSYRVQSLTGNYLDLHGLGAPDGTLFAWLRYLKGYETAKLVVEEPPTRPGNVTITLDGTATNVAVAAVQEQVTLALNPPSTPGALTLTLDNVPFNIPVGGVKEEFQITFNRAPVTHGRVSITAGGQTAFINTGPENTPREIALAFGYMGLPGYEVNVYQNRVNYHALSAGPKTDPVFSAGTTGTLATVEVEVQGSVETATILADRMREVVGADGTGWTTSGTGPSVTFTAIQAGPRVNATYDPGTTGATGTLTQNAEGSAETREALAGRIRAMSFTGWTLSGSANEVIFTANVLGAKQDARYDSGGTGAYGTMETLIQGADGDISAIVKDASGVEHTRKIALGVGTSIFNVDIGVSGADAKNSDGVAYSEAVINVFFSTGTDTKVLKARFEGIDLDGLPAGKALVGVVGESSASGTWEVHGDSLTVTDRGLTHFEDHDYRGALLNQFYYHGPPFQPVRDDIGIQEYIRATMPGTQETWAARLRYDGIPLSQPARPLYITGMTPEGEEVPIGDIAGGLEDTLLPDTVGISGTHDWYEPSVTFTVPENVYELRLNSRKLGVGEIVLQQVGASVGTSVSRTPLYAMNGTHRATLDIATPEGNDEFFWWRQRNLLETWLETPAGTSAAVQYRAGDKQPDGSIVWESTWQTDPLLVSQKDNLQVEVTMNGNAIETPAIKAGTPVADYSIYLSGERVLSAFLKADNTELVGGAAFETFREHSSLSEIVILEKPGGDFDRAALRDPVGQLPEFAVMVFTPEAMRYVEERWGKEYFVIEDAGVALTIKLKGLPSFEKVVRRTKTNGQTHALYTAKVNAGSVVVSEKQLR